YNTYSFFALYANVDGFSYAEEEIPVSQRPEIDRWILSLLNSLVKEVEEAYEDYEPTRAGRAIQDFVIEQLSNWYVRLNRKRFWGGEYDTDKIAAFQTLYTCLETVAMLAAPIAPFYMDQLFTDLNRVTRRHSAESVHLANFPKCNDELIDKNLEEKMEMAQSICSLVLGLRRKVNIKVRQPLQKIMIPILDERFREQLAAVENLILSEVNVKELEYISDSSGILVKKIKPNFKTLGPRYGKAMKAISEAISKMTQEDIAAFERNGQFTIKTAEGDINLTLEDVEILSEDIPGWLVANEGRYTVALDITITEELRMEGIARELINRVQNMRKDSGFEVTDKIRIKIQKHDKLNKAIEVHKSYISTQTLAREIILVDEELNGNSNVIELDDELSTAISVEKIE
ncbi:MAG: class I tRNA ligase family protein, partial [Bacteroidales bacterium]|nr:class I tRNA ligase family protein [Bacteroidales bacterium]